MDVAPFSGAAAAVSDTALQRTGDVTVTPDGLAFGHGMNVSTETLGARDGASVIASGGPAYQDMAPDIADIELRWIGSVSAMGEGAATPSLCADDAIAHYVALMRDGDGSHLFLAVFSGDDEPGPAASDSAVCGAYAYEIE